MSPAAPPTPDGGAPRAGARVRTVERFSSPDTGDGSESDAIDAAAPDSGIAVSPGVARQLDIESADPVRVTAAGGTQVTTATVAEQPGSGTVAVTNAFADRLGVSDGDEVVVEAAVPTVAASVSVAPVAALSVRGGEDVVAAALTERPLIVGTTVTVSLLDGTLDVPVRVVETDPPGVVVIDEGTTITVDSGPAGTVDADSGPVPSMAVGGYESTIAACRSALVQPLTAGDAYDAGGESAATGALVVGQSGVGKSHHVRHAAWLANAEFISLDAARLAAVGHEAAIDHLESIRARATRHARALVHVEGLDALAGAASSGSGAGPMTERFGSWVSRLREQPGVVVAAETREPTELADTLTRGDRFGRRIEVPSPTPADRTAIFGTLTRNLDLAPDVEPATVGERTLGYVAADLVALRARMVETAVERLRTGTDSEEPVTVTATDIDTALSTTTPAASSAAVVDVPDVSLDEVGGLSEAKRELVRVVEWPLRYPAALDRLSIDPPAGVLLYGPPGTGKTLLARAIASTTEANFIAVDGPELFDKFVGESERAVREVFRQARESAPAVIFFDEVDALGATRGSEGGAAPERVVSQLLTELDGLEQRKGVTVIGATNRPDRVDPALLRPGRFDRTVEVGLPDSSAREEILRIHARERPLRDVDFQTLARQTDGYSGSDLAALLREASLAALEEQLGDGDHTPDDVSDLVIRGHHVEAGLSRVTPSARSYDTSDYDDF
jgi:transitional endoplasmic reticulum ATPase